MSVVLDDEGFTGYRWPTDTHPSNIKFSVHKTYPRNEALEVDDVDAESPRALVAPQVVAFRGTDSHSWYNWAENMRFWRSDFGLPFPGAEGALVHSGARPCLRNVLAS